MLTSRRFEREKAASKKVSVLHCIHSLSGGGAERQVRILARESAKFHMEAAIFYVNGTCNELYGRGVQLYRLKDRKKYSPLIFKYLNDVIDDFKPDVIHAWLPASVTIPAMTLAFVRRIPCVYSYRCKMFFERLLMVIEYFVAVIAASAIASNNNIADSTAPYKVLYKIKKGILVRNAVKVDYKYHKRSTKGSMKASCTSRVLFAGRITHQKNWMCFLKAIAILGREKPFEFLVCGEGDEVEKMLDEAERLGILPQILYLGYQQDIYSVMNSSDMLVLPSWWEGAPNVLLEALQIGLPCIVSDIRAHREIVGEHNCALLFDPSAPHELASCINRITSEPALGFTLASRGKIVALDYSPEKMALEYYSLYSSLLH